MFTNALKPAIEKVVDATVSNYTAQVVKLSAVSKDFTVPFANLTSNRRNSAISATVLAVAACNTLNTAGFNDTVISIRSLNPRARDYMDDVLKTIKAEADTDTEMMADLEASADRHVGKCEEHDKDDDDKKSSPIDGDKKAA